MKSHQCPHPYSQIKSLQLHLESNSNSWLWSGCTLTFHPLHILTFIGWSPWLSLYLKNKTSSFQLQDSFTGYFVFWEQLPFIPIRFEYTRVACICEMCFGKSVLNMVFPLTLGGITCSTKTPETTKTKTKPLLNLQIVHNKLSIWGKYRST
jgi:hypothetical protein